MSILRSALVLATVATTSFAATTPIPDLSLPLVFDDFNDTYGDPPARNYPGAFKSYVDNENTYTGNDGYWWIYADATKILNGAGDSLYSTDTKSNMETMVENGAMHVKFKVEQSTKQYPGAEIGCSILGSSDVLDFSKLTAIVLKVKGTGTVRVSLQSKNIADAGDWGYCSDTIQLSSSYTVKTIPIANLKPAPYSASAGKITWADCKKFIKGFTFKTENSKDAELYCDSILFAGMKYSDIISKAAVRPMSMRTVASSNMFTINNSTISYNLANPGNVSFSVFDIEGNLVQQLFNGSASAGNHSILIPQTLTAGSYLVKMNFGNGIYSQKFSILN